MLVVETELIIFKRVPSLVCAKQQKKIETLTSHCVGSFQHALNINKKLILINKLLLSLFISGLALSTVVLRKVWNVIPQNQLQLIYVNNAMENTNV